MKNIETPVVHWYSIKVMKGRDTIEHILWDNLRFELRVKYNWYFKYRAALLQIKYPKLSVETYWGNKPAEGKTLVELLDSKISAKKAQITKYRNKINLAIQNWDSLFPIDDDILYQKAINKVYALECELKQITNQKNLHLIN